jgi:hypothetical protein
VANEIRYESRITVLRISQFLLILALDVLNYCASVATSPDPDDPESVLRQVESERDRERVIDDRLDPYSSRFFPREARTERLAVIIRQERQVERIIRTRTWGLVAERCGEVADDWEAALNEWRKGREPRGVSWKE